MLSDMGRSSWPLAGNRSAVVRAGGRAMVVAVVVPSSGGDVRSRRWEEPADQSSESTGGRNEANRMENTVDLQLIGV